MEYCLTINFDLLELTKLLSPWLLAGIAYWLWHKQKEKEIIANESKNLLKIINELKSCYSMIYVQYHLYINSNENFDKDYYQKAKKEYYETEKAFTSKITFLLMLIQDIEISQLYEKIKLNQAKFSATEFLFENQEDVNSLQELDIRLEKQLNQLKFKLVYYAMYKNKIKISKNT